MDFANVDVIVSCIEISIKKNQIVLLPMEYHVYYEVLFQMRVGFCTEI